MRFVKGDLFWIEELSDKSIIFIGEGAVKISDELKEENISPKIFRTEDRYGQIHRIVLYYKESLNLFYVDERCEKAFRKDAIPFSGRNLTEETMQANLDFIKTL